MVPDYSGTPLYHTIGTVHFRSREFSQLTFSHFVEYCHLVQYKIFQDVAVEVQLVCNCTSSLGRIKAEAFFFFSLSPHI